LLGRIAGMQQAMWPIATDVAHSVVCVFGLLNMGELCKNFGTDQKDSIWEAD